VCFVLAVLASPFKSKLRLEAENAVLRHQLIEVAQSSVAKYMVKRRAPPSRGWRTFLRNHAADIAAMDLFVVPTIGFDLLYAFVIVRLDRRDLIWINVTANPTAVWVARQITEAFPWDEAPYFLIRDRDRIYGSLATRRLRAMGNRDKPTAPASPWQNGFVERLIGSIRRECVDHIIVLGEVHLRQILQSYARYYAITMTSGRTGHWTKMHQSLVKFSESEASNHTPSLADFTTTTPELKFSVHTRRSTRRSLRAQLRVGHLHRRHRHFLALIDEHWCRSCRPQLRVLADLSSCFPARQHPGTDL
jgi:hypothetical protein